MSRLIDLNPRIYPRDDLPDAWSLIFLCPKCRKHELSVPFWPWEAGEQPVTDSDGRRYKLRLWKGTTGGGFRQDDLGLDDLSLFPSINREGLGDKCGGWHGFINHGVAR